MFPLILCVLTPIIRTGLKTTGGSITNKVLTTVGLRDNKGAEIKHLQDGVNTMQSSVNTLQSSVDILQSSVTTVQSSVDTLGENIANQTSMLSAIQSSIGAIGAISSVGCALSAVNVYQLVKVQKAIRSLDTKISDGFIDLRVHFDQKLDNLLEYQQKQRLASAYTAYNHGVEYIKTALLIKDKVNRNNHLTHCISTFNQSLSVYDTKDDYQASNLPAKLRRLECCWSIQSSIAEVYTLQEEYAASLHSYKTLQQRIFREIDSFKSELNAENYHFITADLHWLFENDLKLISTKISLLEQYEIQKIFIPANFEVRQTEADAPIVEQASLLSAKEFIHCIVSGKQEHVTTILQDKESLQLIEPEYGTLDVKDFSLLQYCNSYVQLLSVLSDQTISTELDKIVERYQSVLSKGAIFFKSAIPPRKLAAVLRSYAEQINTEEKYFILIDNTFFGSATDGIFLTDKAIYSDEFGRISLDTIYSVELAQNTPLSIIINGNKVITINGLKTDVALRFVQLMRDIRDTLHSIYFKQGLLFEILLDHSQAEISFRKTTALKPDDINGFEYLVYLGIDDPLIIQDYLQKLIATDNLEKLEKLVQFKLNNEQVLFNYCEYLLTLDHHTKINALLQQTKSPQVLLMYANHLSDPSNLANLDRFDALVASYPDNSALLWKYAIFQRNTQQGERAIETFSKLRTIAPVYETEAVCHEYALALTDLGYYQEALIIYQELAVLTPNDTEVYWSQIQLLMKLECYTDALEKLNQLNSVDEVLLCRLLLSVKLHNYSDVQQLGKQLFDSKIFDSKRHEHLLDFLVVLNKE